VSWLDWDIVRWVNVALSFGVVTVMTMGAWYRWKDMPTRFKRITPWVILTYVIIAYGSGEVAANPGTVSPGVRVGLMSLTLIGLLIALLYRIDDPDYSEDGPVLPIMKPDDSD